MRTLLLTAIAITFLFTLTTQAEGAEWVKVKETEKYILYLDLNSITKLSDNHYKGWSEMVLKDPSEKADKMMAYIEYDCDNKRKRLLQLTVYKNNGEVITDTEIQSWNYAIPDSSGKRTLTLVCNYYRGNWKRQEIERR